MTKPKPRPENLVITEEFVNMLSKVLLAFKGDIKRSRMWIITPNLNLGGFPPLKLFMMGKGARVIEFVEDMATVGIELKSPPREWTLRRGLSGFDSEAHIEGPALGSDEIIKVREIIE